MMQAHRLDPRSLIVPGGAIETAQAAVRQMLIDVSTQGGTAIVEIARRFDDADFRADRIRVQPAELAEAAGSISAEMRNAIRRSIEQVRFYQQRIMPQDVAFIARPGVELGLRHTAIDEVGLYVPGGKASYPSSLIMLAVPAQVAGVRRIAVVTPAGKFGDNALLFAAAHELGIRDMFRAGGAAGIAALTFGTRTIRPVQKIVGQGNSFVQMAKRMVAGAVGVDGFLGPSEILTLADASGNPAYIAADLVAQAEHDPGRCFLLTDDEQIAERVLVEIQRQLASRDRADAIVRGLSGGSAIVIGRTMAELIDLANQIAAEHVNLQVRDPAGVLAAVRHAGAVFVGQDSPVAAGDYVAGPSHCLPTNSTARFAGGISVFEFLKRTGTIAYEKSGLAADAPAIAEIARAEGLDAHAASVSIRLGDRTV